MNCLDKILVILRLIAEQSGEGVSDARLKFVSERLLPYGTERVCDALTKLLDSSRRFPTVDEVRTAMGEASLSGRDVGMQIANLLLDGVRRFGEATNPRTAAAIERALGETAWRVVTALGGWNAVVEAAAGEHFRAQVRDLVDSLVKTGGLVVDCLPASLPSLANALEATGTTPALPSAKAQLLAAKRDELVVVRDRLLRREIGDGDADALMTAVARKYDALESEGRNA